MRRSAVMIDYRRMREKPRACALIIFFMLILHVTAGVCLGVPGLSRTPEGWLQANGPREWSFPRDHGSHPGYRTEWWYFTGILRSSHGERYGFQLTFFRQGIRLRPTDPGNAWSIRDIYLAHFTVTNVQTGQFVVNERVSRTGPDLAGARRDRLDVYLLDWFARQKGNGLRPFCLRTHSTAATRSLSGQASCQARRERLQPQGK